MKVKGEPQNRRISSRRTAELKVKEEHQDVESFNRPSRSNALSSFDIHNNLVSEPTKPKDVLVEKKLEFRPYLSFLWFCGSIFSPRRRLYEPEAIFCGSKYFTHVYKPRDSSSLKILRLGWSIS